MPSPNTTLKRPVLESHWLPKGAGKVSGFRLDNKVALVTGGGSGIGQAIALCFAEHGAAIRIVDLNEKAAEETSERIRQLGGNATAHRCDVANPLETKVVFRKILEMSRLDILVNSAGISHVGRLENTSDEIFERVFRVNVQGTHNAMQQSIEAMVAQGGGVIVNLASIAASAGLEDRYAYSMSKGAVRSMTYSVARDYLRHNVRCNAISPARVHTPFVDGFIKKNFPGKESEAFRKLSAAQPIGRMAQPCEVAMLALYLCSDESSFITGTDYPLDGGFFNLHG
jgi:NAD(P)-dependent dehydrogenase (short-subunit alcohol dehydrogenase family)